MSSSEYTCPMCGEKLPEGHPNPIQGHRCSEEKLKRIGAARTRDYTQERTPSESERYKDGFAILDDEEDLTDADDY